MEQLNLTQEWDKVFPKSDKVDHKKVTFHNRYGITLAADMYTPKSAEGKLPAIAVSGQLKTMLDRANPLFGTDYAFTKAYLLATAAEDAPETVEGTVKAVQGWVDCFGRCELAATVFAGGVNGIGDIAGHPALDTAYQTGREV